MDLASSPPPVLPHRKRQSTPCLEKDETGKFSSLEEELASLRKSNIELRETIDALKKTLAKAS